MEKELQDSLIDTIKILVNEVIKQTPYTSSHIGKIKEINGFDCTVELYGEDMQCKLMEHLHDNVKVGDIVIVQDLYNDKVQKYVQSKIGETAND